MKGIMSAVIKGYNDFRNLGCRPVVAAIFTLGGVALGIGIDLVIAFIFMFLYNNLARTFNWPISSIWFWFIGLHVTTIIFSKKENNG